MKIGAENSKKTILAVGLFAVALLLFIRMFAGGGKPGAASTSANASAVDTPRPTVRPGPRSTAQNSNAANPNLDPRLRLRALEEAENTDYKGNGRNIFLAQASEPVDIPKPVAPGMKDQANAPAAPAVYTPPPPPPIELKFFGFASTQGSKRVFLAKGDDVFVASEGDIVNRRYKIVKINANSIEVQDVLNNNRQTIPLTAG